jgi:hypothetical protein
MVATTSKGRIALDQNSAARELNDAMCAQEAFFFANNFCAS